MAASLVTCASLTNMMLNAATVYGAGVTNPRWFTAGISDALLSQDGVLCSIICANPKHGRRQQFLTTSAGFVNKTQVPSHVGPIENVQFTITGTTSPYAGQTITADEVAPESWILIDNDNQNPNLRNLWPRYAMLGNTIAHNAAGMAKAAGVTSISVTVTYANYIRTTALQAPDEFFTADWAGALATLFPAEGENVPAASLFEKIWQEIMDTIATGLPTIPQFRLQQQLQQGQALGTE